METVTYKTQILTEEYYKIFTGLYNDFKLQAVSNYKFELNPLPYEEFIDAVENKLIQCLILLENEIPTAFLVYTSAISESIELNIIHCLGNEDIINKQKCLMNLFLETTKFERKKKVVCYPMLGSQANFTSDIAHFGFKFVGLAVLRFMMGNAQSERILENMSVADNGSAYTITTWSDEYLEDAIKIIHANFKEASDAKFDTRFLTKEGTKDIVDKIVNSIYGEFLPEATSVLLHCNVPVGVVFVNVTGNQIANIPLVAINKEHRGKGLSEVMLQKSVRTVVDWVKLGQKNYSEINVTAETNNYQALKMYRHVGFKEDFSYPQAYLPVQK